MSNPAPSQYGATDLGSRKKRHHLRNVSLAWTIDAPQSVITLDEEGDEACDVGDIKRSGVKIRV